MSEARHKNHYIDNQDGWQLELKQCHPPKRVLKKRRPLCIIPGYGMNSFIFGYHPSGLSMESYFTREGFEVWSVNLRGQGGAKALDGESRYGLRDLGITDLSKAVQFIADNSRSEAGQVDLIGCSLGGTLSYIYTALVKKNLTGSIVGMGAPLRWEKVHPLLKMVFASPKLLGKIPIFGVRELLSKIYPQLLKSPLVKIYLHPEMVDLADPERFLETIENPNRAINEEIARWMKTKDLTIAGKNLTEAFRKVKNPLLCVLANSDGVVPPLTALSSLEIAGSKVKDTLVVGTDDFHFSHADLFVSRHSHDMVFNPVAKWLKAQYKS